MAKGRPPACGQSAGTSTSTAPASGPAAWDRTRTAIRLGPFRSAAAARGSATPSPRARARPAAGGAPRRSPDRRTRTPPRARALTASPPLRAQLHGQRWRIERRSPHRPRRAPVVEIAVRCWAQEVGHCRWRRRGTTTARVHSARLGSGEPSSLAAGQERSPPQPSGRTTPPSPTRLRRRRSSTPRASPRRSAGHHRARSARASTATPAPPGLPGPPRELLADQLRAAASAALPVAELPSANQSPRIEIGRQHPDRAGDRLSVRRASRSASARRAAPRRSARSGRAAIAARWVSTPAKSPSPSAPRPPPPTPPRSRPAGPCSEPMSWLRCMLRLAAATWRQGGRDRIARPRAGTSRVGSSSPRHQARR